MYNKCKQHYPSHLLWQCMIWAPTHPLAELMRQYPFSGTQPLLEGIWSMLSQVSGSGNNFLCLKIFWFEIKDCLHPGSHAVYSTKAFSLHVPISPACYYKIFFSEHIHSLGGKVWGHVHSVCNSVVRATPAIAPAQCQKKWCQLFHILHDVLLLICLSSPSTFNNSGS